MKHIWEKRLLYFCGIILWLTPFIILAQEETPPPEETPTQPEQPQASEQAPASEPKNIFFLDRAKGEPAELTKELEAVPDKDAVTLTKLGMLYLIYQNDLTKPQEYFQQALAKEPANLQAMQGLGSVYKMQYEQEADGKLDLQYLQVAPDDPRSELILRYLGGNMYYIRLPLAQRIEILTNLLATPMKNKINEALVRQELSGYRRELYGQRDDEAFQLWQGCGYIDKWIVIGYFGPYGEIAFNEVLPPEKKIDLSKKYTVLDWEIAYHQRKATITNYDEFNQYIDKPLKNQGAVRYLLTYIKSPSDRWAALRIDNAEGYKVWVNDNLMGELNRFRSHQPRETAVSVFLNEGWNKVLIKFLAGGGEVRLTDPAGGGYADLVYEVDFPGDKLPEVKSGLPPEPPATCFMGAIDTYAERLNDQARPSQDGGYHKTTYDYSGLATLYEVNGLEQESFNLWEELYNVHKDNTWANVAMAHAYQQNNYLPQEKRLNQARACAERARELNPKNMMALFYLADYYESKDKDKSLNYLKEAVKLRPDNLELHRQMLSHYQQRNWQAEYFAELKAMDKLASDNPVVWSMWSDYYSHQGNHEKVYEYALRRQKYYGAKYDWVTVSHREQLGDYEYSIAERLKFLEDKPEEVYYYRHLIELYGRINKYEEAEKLWAKILELSAEGAAPAGGQGSASGGDGEAYRYYPELANFYWEWNKPEQAKEYWAKIIALPMKYHSDERDSAQEFMEFMAGATGWEKPYEIKAEEVIKNAPGEKEYPKVSTITLLEQHLVRITGDTEPKGREESVHQIIKIMNKKGGERYGDLWQRGNVQEARVFLPDGRILEPEPLQDGGTRLPELDKGSVIDVKYTSRRPYYYQTPDEFSEIFSAGSFRRAKEPLIHLQYVLIIPKSIKYNLRQKNMGDLKPQITETDTTTTYVWEAKNQADYDPEQWMPSQRELFPWVELSQGQFSMERLNREVLSGHLEEKVPDNVRAKALELTKDLATRDEKVRALYQFCVTEIKGGWGGYSGGGSRSYRGGYGGASGNDTSLSQTLIEKEGQVGPLFMAMLRAVDIEAYWALARPQFRPYEEVERAGPGFGEAGLIYLPGVENNKEVWLAPGQFVPFGVIPNGIQGGEAYIVMKNGARIVELPTAPFEERCNGAMKIDITIDNEGNSECQGSLGIGGSQGAQMRMYLKEHATEQVKKMMVEQIIGQLFAGSQVKQFDIPEFQMDERVARLVFECTAPQFLTKTKKSWRFKPIIRPLELSNAFLRETERKFPLRISGFAEGLNNVDRLTVTVPAGTEIAPPPNVTLWTEFGTYSLTILQKDDTLEIERRFQMKEGDISVEAYPRFVEFCKQIEKAEKARVSLGEAKE